MKTFYIKLLLLLAFFPTVSVAQNTSSPLPPIYGNSRKSAEPRPVKRAFAVIEYFTNENYYLASSVIDQARRLQIHNENSEKLIVPIVYHVNYGLNPEWHDPYSSELFADLQKRYATTLKTSAVAPGQTVINGRRIIAPNQAVAVHSDMQKVLKRNPRAGLVLKHEVIHSKKFPKIVIDYEVIGVSKSRRKDYQMTCLITEDDIERKIERGPNGGKTLNHAAIVRAYKKTNFSKKKAKGNLEMRYPSSMQTENSRLTCIIQDPETLTAICADSQPL